MTTLHCLRENHQKYDITFYYKDQEEWKLACLQCQYESFLNKDSFIPIQHLEKVNQESMQILFEDDVQQRYFDQKANMKQWIAKFQTALDNVQQTISKQDSEVVNRTEILSTFKVQDLTYNTFQTIIESRETIRDDIQQKKSYLQDVEKKFQQAYDIISGLVDQGNNQKKVLKREELIYQKVECEKQQELQNESIQQQQFAVSQQIQPQQQSQKAINLQIYQTPGENFVQEKQNKQATKYQGDYKNGKYHGHGVLQYDGFVYTGFFENGMKHGKGEIKKEEGNYKYVFQGLFVKDKKHGHGTLIETFYEDEETDFTQSIFKLAKNQNRNCKIIKLEGHYENDIKNTVFLEERIENDISKKRQILYENDQFVMDFTD